MAANTDFMRHYLIGKTKSGPLHAHVEAARFAGEQQGWTYAYWEIVLHAVPVRASCDEKPLGLSSNQYLSMHETRVSYESSALLDGVPLTLRKTMQGALEFTKLFRLWVPSDGSLRLSYRVMLPRWRAMMPPKLGGGGWLRS